MSAPVHERFGRYALVDRIGAGGMAEVFRARLVAAAGVEKLLVIKRMLPDLANSADFVEMFVDEARMAATFEHPNIVSVFDFGEVSGRFFIAMEHVAGTDLATVLRAVADRREVMPPEFAALVAHDVCRALAYAHDLTDAEGRPLQVVHRDICHANVLVGWDGQVKVTDFGVARSEVCAAPERTDVLQGHIAYMSPEQSACQPTDLRSDLFSLGVVLHEALTGRRLFRADTHEETVRRLRSDDIPRPSERNRHVPPSLDPIVLRALERHPERRYQGARELQADLATFLGTPGVDLTRERFAAWLGDLFADRIAAERAVLLPSPALAAAPRPDVTGSLDPTVADLEPPEHTVALPRSGSVWPAVAVVALLFTVVFGAAVWTLGEAPGSKPQATGEVVGAGGAEVVTAEVDEEGPREVVEARGAEVAALEGVETGGAEGVAAKPPEAPVASLSIATASRTPPPAPGRSPATPAAPEAGSRSAEAGSPSAEPAPPPPPEELDIPDLFDDFATASRTPPPAPGSLKVARDPGEAGSRTPEAGSPPAQPTQPAKLTVQVRSGWGYVSIDGKKLSARPPIVDYELPPGTYVVRIEKPTTGRVYTRQVVLVAGEEIEVVFD